MSKKYMITVNGNSYEVTVEEIGGDTAAAPVQKAEISSSAFAAKPEAPVKAQGGAGSKKIEAPMPGSIVKVNVSTGASFKKGDVLVVLEAMKMENEISASEDGVVASVAVSVGGSVETGGVLITYN